ncbi:hemerythrin domain-containing protein [Sphingomonas sp. RS2018]
MTLDLPDRTGLPDTIAYLRAGHPQPTWRTHRNFGELAGFWLHIHDTLRGEASILMTLLEEVQAGRADLSQATPRFVPAFNGFLQHLDAHHRIEDGAYFPRFRALDPRMERGFELLEADHVLIDQRLHATIDTARAMLAASASDDRRRAIDASAAAIAELRALLGRHLADEEDIVIPALLEHGERSIGH